MWKETGLFSLFIVASIIERNKNYTKASTMVQMPSIKLIVPNLLFPLPQYFAPVPRISWNNKQQVCNEEMQD